MQFLLLWWGTEKAATLPVSSAWSMELLERPGVCTGVYTAETFKTEATAVLNQVGSTKSTVTGD